jgi:hypothetical protein
MCNPNEGQLSLKSLDRYKQCPHKNMERKTERELPEGSTGVGNDPVTTEVHFHTQ